MARERTILTLGVVIVFLAASFVSIELNDRTNIFEANATPDKQIVKEWDKTFGGPERDEGRVVAQTSDGGYIITGRTGAVGKEDVLLIKTDKNGDKQWDKTYGGPLIENVYSVAQTSDGGYIMIGYTYSNSAGFNGDWLIKTDADGNKIWNKTFDGIASLIKADASEGKEWEGIFGGASGGTGIAIARTSDGGYGSTNPMIGYAVESNDDDVWLVKRDSSGFESWNKTFGGMQLDMGWAIAQSSDGGYVITGYTYSYGHGGGKCDAWLIKTDANGTEQWNKTFGGTSLDGGKSVVQTTDGGYLITGNTKSYGAGDRDAWLIKTDANGTEQWNKTFGGPEWDWGNSVIQTSDGGCIITGFTESYSDGAGDRDVWLIKVGEGEGRGGDTPGFQFMLLLAAAFIALWAWQKRRYR